MSFGRRSCCCFPIGQRAGRPESQRPPAANPVSDTVSGSAHWGPFHPAGPSSYHSPSEWAPSPCPPEDLSVLNQGTPDPTGPIAEVSAGTGLGEALLYWDGTTYRTLPSEGGHADFSPRNELEAELLLYLRAEHGRVSTERVVSGTGLRNIYRFLRDGRRLPESPAVAEAMRKEDPSVVITRTALAGVCPLCGQTLDLFVSLYGAEAGNVALRYLATGGVFLGGGIAPKIIERLLGPGFMLAFTAKGRLSPLMEKIPVRVILNDRSAILGACRYALLRASASTCMDTPST